MSSDTGIEELEQKLDKLIDEIWCAGYNAGANDTDDDNTQFIKDMRIEILKFFNQPKATKPVNKNSTSNKKLEVVHNYNELEQILSNLDLRVDEGQAYLYDNAEVIEQIIAWHETEIQKARFKELISLGKLYNGSRKTWCDYYEERYSYLKKKTEQL